MIGDLLAHLHESDTRLNDADARCLIQVQDTVHMRAENHHQRSRNLDTTCQSFMVGYRDDMPVVVLTLGAEPPYARFRPVLMGHTGTFDSLHAARTA